MQPLALLFSTAITLLASTVRGAPSTAGTAILQFQIGPDTYTSDTELGVPGELVLDDGGLDLMGATIADVTGVADERTLTCQAFNGEDKVGAPLTLFGEFTAFGGVGEFVTVTRFTCG